jgi:hypothetical protein
VAGTRTRRLYPDGAFPTDATSPAQLVGEGVSVEYLRQLGIRAIGRGYELRLMRYANILPGTPPLRCFPRLADSWREIDGTIPFSDADQARRFERGPAWEENSCALDCVLVAALMLDAGRRRVDNQLDQEAMRGLAPIPRALLYAIRKPWSELGPESIRSLRNSLRQMLTAHDPERFPPGRFWGVYSVADALFAGLPQLHATWTFAYACCTRNPLNWQYRRDADGALRTRVVRGLPTLTNVTVPPPPPPNPAGPRTLEALVSDGFSRQPLTSSEAQAMAKCGSASCPSPLKVPVLLDRLPPVLVLTEDNFDIEAPNPPGLFGPIQIQCVNTGLELTQKASYQAVGYIVCQNRSHFTLCWQQTGQGIAKAAYFQARTYDGLVNGGKFINMPSLSTAYPKGATLVMLFLEKIGS